MQTHREGFEAVVLEAPGSYCAYASLYFSMCFIRYSLSMCLIVIYHYVLHLFFILLEFSLLQHLHLRNSKGTVSDIIHKLWIVTLFLY
jgi:hypothetical protein